MSIMLIDVSKMPRSNVFDVVTVGHFAVDIIKTPKITQSGTMLGGPPTYVSIAAAKLGAKVSVISKVGNDFPEEYLLWLRKNNVDLSGLKQVSRVSTTRFVLIYDRSKRKMQLQACGPPIFPRDIPDNLQAKIVHVAPIAGEVSPKVVSKLRGSVEVLSLDLQGFVRSFDVEGNVSLKRWRDTEVLGQIDVFKSSIEEIQAVTGTRDLKASMKQIADLGARVVLVTKGIQGSTMLLNNSFYNIPACESKIVVDPTGAGDAFIGGFLAEYNREKEPVLCACVGSASASFVVEGIGSERFGEKEETYERAREIYEKLLKTG